MMRNYPKIILLVFLICNICSFCFANPFSSFMALFQKDLEISIIYKDHKNLIQGSKVYLANNPNGQKTLIGEVKKISLGESSISNVKVMIDKQYKEKMYESTPFVLMSKFFSKDSNTHIVAISSLNPVSNTLLKSGSSIKGFTFLEYKVTTAKEGLKKTIAGIKKQNQELMSQLKGHIDTLDTDEFQKKTGKLANQITKFSREQKEAFKKNVLPDLKKMFNSIIKKLEEQNNKEKSKAFKQQLHEIEKTIDA